jgi:hypothetical protein
MPTRLYSVVASVINIGALKAWLHLSASMNLSPHCPHLFPDLGEIRPKGSARRAYVCFVKVVARESRTLLADVNQITFTPVT